MWADSGHACHPCDIVHATAFPYAFPITCALRMARRLAVPFVLTPFLHLGDPDNPHDPVRRQYTTPALMSLVRAADCVFVQTSGERDALLQRGIGEEKLVILGMGVDPCECTGGDRQRLRHALGIRADEVVVGHLGNNSREKGTVDLLQAAERVWTQGCSFHVVLAGPEMPNFQRFWKSFQSSGPVHRLGVLDERQKRDFFAASDLFVLPSRSDSFGLVLLEAWANGVPNLAYRAGGIADVVRHGQDGWLAPCGEVAALAEGLKRLVNDADLRRHLGRAGQDRLPREFRWEDKLKRVCEVYERCCMRFKKETGPVPISAAPI
jgi:glycosyltransferase involved in cell wall biosynthesis